MTSNLRDVSQNAQQSPGPRPRSTPHHHGAIRIEEQPGGRTSIVAIRIVNRSIQKKRLDLTAEEFRALDAALRESFGRTTETPGPQLTLDLPTSRPEPAIPLPRGPHHARPKRFYFARRGGKREG